MQICWLHNLLSIFGGRPKWYWRWYNCQCKNPATNNIAGTAANLSATHSEVNLANVLPCWSTQKNWHLQMRRKFLQEMLMMLSPSQSWKRYPDSDAFMECFKIQEKQDVEKPSSATQCHSIGCNVSLCGSQLFRITVAYSSQTTEEQRLSVIYGCNWQCSCKTSPLQSVSFILCTLYSMPVHNSNCGSSGGNADIRSKHCNNSTLADLPASGLLQAVPERPETTRTEMEEAKSSKEKIKVLQLPSC